MHSAAGTLERIERLAHMRMLLDQWFKLLQAFLKVATNSGKSVSHASLLVVADSSRIHTSARP
jgi:hypothetical protein